MSRRENSIGRGGHWPGRRWVIGTLLGLALTGAGCGGDDEEPPAAQEPTRDAAEGAGTSRDPEETPAATETPAPEDAAAETLASRDGAIDGEPVLLEIVELRRSGDTMTLSFRLTLKEGASDTSAQVAGTFSDGAYEEITGPASSGDNSALTSNLDGISLIDGVNRKRHLVARDSYGMCVCDVDLASKFVTRDSSVVLSATFAAPPADVEAMDVQMPSFGTFANVPLS